MSLAAGCLAGNMVCTNFKANASTGLDQDELRVDVVAVYRTKRAQRPYEIPHVDRDSIKCAMSPLFTLVGRFYEKLSHRYKIAAILKYLWRSTEHRCVQSNV